MCIIILECYNMRIRRYTEILKNEADVFEKFSEKRS